MNNLRAELHELQMELNATQSDKYFLQRLCSDIKLALKSHINYNKVKFAKFVENEINNKLRASN